MGFTERKFEIAIFGLSILLVGGLGYLLKNPVQEVLGAQEQEVVYEMPRPKASFLAALFSIGDREISRRYVNPFAKKKADDKKATANKAPSAVPKKAVAAKKTDSKKKEQTAQKKVDVQIVGDNSPQAVAGEDIANSPVAKAQKIGAATVAEGSPVDSDQAKNTLSGSQWRALILAQPTKENMSKLVEAYRAKEVDDATFYTIVADLYRDNKVENQQLGLLGVSSVFNSQSFEITARYYDQLAPEVQAKAQTYLLSYAVNSRLPILMTSLQSSNAEVVTMAIEVVLAGYQKARDGVSPTSDPRSLRGDAAVNSVASYSKFLPIFQKLSQSSDTMVAGVAATALSQIQVSVAAL